MNFPIAKKKKKTGAILMPLLMIESTNDEGRNSLSVWRLYNIIIMQNLHSFWIIKGMLSCQNTLRVS